MSIYEEHWHEERQEYVSDRKVGKPLGPNAPHYPNKAERVLLTQMMQKSGMTEEQIRAVKENRIALANASKSTTSPRGDEDFRYKLRVKRSRRATAKRLACEVWELK